MITKKITNLFIIMLMVIVAYLCLLGLNYLYHGNYKSYLIDYPKNIKFNLLINGWQTKYYFGEYEFENSANWNEGIPFNYFLFQDRGFDRGFKEDFVNDFYYQNGFVYYTSIDGSFENHCYNDNRLKFSRINLGSNTIERDLAIQDFTEIYQKISHVFDRDKRFLAYNLKCDIQSPS